MSHSGIISFSRHPCQHPFTSIHVCFSGQVAGRYDSRPDRMAGDVFRPSWTTPSIEFAILPPAKGRGSQLGLVTRGVSLVIWSLFPVTLKDEET